LRICCAVHGPFGLAVTPRMCTHRESTSITKKQYWVSFLGAPKLKNEAMALRPDIAIAVGQIRADMAEADHAYANRKSFAYYRERFIEESAHPDGLAGPGADLRPAPDNYGPISGLHGP
jgi:hypothetical protein